MEKMFNAPLAAGMRYAIEFTLRTDGRKSK